MKLIRILVLGMICTSHVYAGDVPLDGIAYKLIRGSVTNAVGIYVERVFHDRYSILEIKHLTDSDIRELQEFLKPVESLDLSDNFCGHDPGFAVTVFRRNKLVYEASYCFKCDTIGKGTKSGWNRLAMTGTETDKQQLQLFLDKWFNEELQHEPPDGRVEAPRH
jgi:hypothetical protein